MKEQNNRLLEVIQLRQKNLQKIKKGRQREMEEHTYSNDRKGICGDTFFIFGRIRRKVA